MMPNEKYIFVPDGHLLRIIDTENNERYVINPGDIDIPHYLDHCNVPLDVQYEVYLYLDMPLAAIRVSFRRFGRDINDIWSRRGSDGSGNEG